MCNFFLPNEKHVERSKRTLRGPVGASWLAARGCCSSLPCVLLVAPESDGGDHGNGQGASARE